MKRFWLFLFLAFFALSGCGKKKDSPTTNPSQQPVDEPEPSPKPTPGTKLESLLAISSEGIRSGIEGMNFGTGDRPLWGKPEWVYYYKPWQKDDENWFARVKVRFTDLEGAVQDKALLMGCHYHDDGKMACHRSDKKGSDLGDEPGQDDNPTDPPPDDDCSDPFGGNCPPPF